MARYSIFVLKVLLNTNQPTLNSDGWCYCVTQCIFSGGFYWEIWFIYLFI